MERSTKVFIAGIGFFVLVISCNLFGASLTGQTGVWAQSAADIVQAQALAEQAQANQQLAQAVQSLAHTLNWLLLVVLLLACLGAGLYVWKTQRPPSPPSQISAPPPSLRMVYLPPQALSEGHEPDPQTEEILQALLSGKEWK